MPLVLFSLDRVILQTGCVIHSCLSLNLLQFPPVFHKCPLLFRCWDQLPCWISILQSPQWTFALFNEVFGVCNSFLSVISWNTLYNNSHNWHTVYTFRSLLQVFVFCILNIFWYFPYYPPTINLICSLSLFPYAKPFTFNNPISPKPKATKTSRTTAKPKMKALPKAKTSTDSTRSKTKAPAHNKRN